jgi:hypothetical protein
MNRYLFPTLGLCLCTAVMAAPALDHKWDICWHGNDITVDDEAVYNAFMEKGACLGTCEDCEGMCCLQGGDFLILTQTDCATVGGRFQWDIEGSCAFGAVD